jgi:hypothetical protein
MRLSRYVKKARQLSEKVLSEEHLDTLDIPQQPGGIVSLPGPIWQALHQTRLYFTAHPDGKCHVPQIWSSYVMVVR